MTSNRHERAAQLYANLAGIADLGALDALRLDTLLAQLRQFISRAELATLVEDIDVHRFQAAGDGYMREWGYDRWRWETGPNGHLWDAVTVIPVGDYRLLGTGELLVASEDWKLEEEQQDRFIRGQDSQDILERQLEQQIRRWEADKEGTILRFVLGRLHLEARRLIYHLHAKPGVLLAEPPYFALDRPAQIAVTKDGYRFERGTRDLFSPCLLRDLLHERRKPFGVCARQGCEQAFVQPQRGRPRSYCSDTCKERSMPCRRDNSAKVRERRRAARRTEVEETAALLGRTTEGQWLSRVRKKFPDRTELQCRRLIRLATGLLQRRGRRAKGPDPVLAKMKKESGRARPSRSKARSPRR